MVAVCAVLTDETLAVKPALAAPAGIVTEEGTVTALLLLDKLTASPPDPAAADKLTVHASLPAPVIEPLLQVTALSTPEAACPVPLRLTDAELGEALSVNTRFPVTAPDDVGLKLTDKVAVWPGLSVTGKLSPEALNPAPVTLAALMVSGTVPDEVRVSVSVAVLFTATDPKLRLPELNLSPGTAAPRLIAYVCVAPPAEAVKVAVCAVLTDEMVAVNPALAAPAGTVTEEGTVTALLSLDRLTASPPDPAAADRLTVQASVPAPVTEPLLQVSPLREAVLVLVLFFAPFPVSLMVVEEPGAPGVPPAADVEALEAVAVRGPLSTITCPLASPSTVGLKCRARA